MNDNYKIVKNEFVEDMESECTVYRHKCGAVIITAVNNDDNKVFSVTFKTLPENDKGIPHIMEHSVLCGSKKYPVKDPFNELEKGSINTYLNAMTYSDKTMYPIGSTNEKDFFNLMSVYLDAVFAPLIFEREGIFLQEGRHFENDSVNGVVFNEMKGALSDPVRKLNLQINKELFSDTNYKYYSGGVPEKILDLSYKEFLEFYRKHYHPANSIIYLYGDIEPEKYLEYLDSEYLSKFEYSEIITEYVEQKKASDIKETVGYYTVDEYSEENKNYLGASVIVGKGYDAVLSMVFGIILEALLETEASPIKIELIKNNIGKNIYGSFNDSMYESVFSIIVEKSEQSDSALFRKTIFDTLNNILEKGIDKKLFKSIINKHKFYIMEQDYGYKPKGLFYNTIIAKNFVYGKNDFEAVKFKKIFEKIEKIDFLDIIKTFLLENKNWVFGILKPKVKTEDSFNFGCTEKTEEEKIIEYRKIKDERKDIEKIPLIDINNINKNIKKIPFICDSVLGRELIYSNIENNDIVYADFMFEIKNIKKTELYCVGILEYALSKISTKHMAYENLSKEIGFYFGGFNVTYENFSISSNEYRPFLSVNTKFLKKYIKNVFPIIQQVITESVFEHKRLLELINEYKILIEKSFIMNGNIFAALRAGASFNCGKNFSENIRGVNFYFKLKEILNGNFSIDAVVEELKNVFEKLFIKNNFMSVVVCENKIYNSVKKEIEDVCSSLKKVNNEIIEFIPDFCAKKECVLTYGDVNFNSLAADFSKLNYSYNGKLKVINKIVTSDYLWNTIRVEGGAYGAGSRFFMSGYMYLYSYRDPNIKKTYDFYKNIPSYFENMNISEREINKYIIGTVSDMDRPVKISKIADIIVERHIIGITDEIRERQRAEVLSFEKNDIKYAAEIFESCIKNSAVCSFVGNYDKKEIVDIFDKQKYI